MRKLLNVTATIQIVYILDITWRTESFGTIGISIMDHVDEVIPLIHASVIYRWVDVQYYYYDENINVE